MKGLFFYILKLLCICFLIDKLVGVEKKEELEGGIGRVFFLSDIFYRLEVNSDSLYDMLRFEGD